MLFTDLDRKEIEESELFTQAKSDYPKKDYSNIELIGGPKF